MTNSRPESDFYAQTMASLEARERELMLELEKVRAMRAALKPLERSNGGATGQAPGATVVRLNLDRDIRPKSLAEAARRVLVNAGRPLHIRTIIEGVQIAGLMRGRSFEAIRASLTPTLIRRRDLFVKIGRAVYGLVQDQEKKAE